MPNLPHRYTQVAINVSHLQQASVAMFTERHKLWVIVGTRPEVIKQVPLLWALRQRLGDEQVALVGSGQHRELLTRALAHFGETTDINFDLMVPKQAVGPLAASVLARMDAAVLEYRPETIIVQGDTTTAAMTAIAAFHRAVRLVHNEAGLRTYDLANPWPEEANRRWISAVADIHLCPTERARSFLLREGTAAHRIHVVGNTGIDALLWTLQRPCPGETRALLNHCIERRLQPVLVTAHRRENDPETMDTWFNALKQFVTDHRDILLVCPMHPNLRARHAAHTHLAAHPRVRIREPLDYASTCHVLSCSRFVVTDSGGLQEEAATLGVPAVVCRKATERAEAVELGLSRLASPDDSSALTDAMEWACALGSDTAARAALMHLMPFGDGRSAPRAATALFPLP